jgi:hypothetical protein
MLQKLGPVFCVHISGEAVYMLFRFHVKYHIPHCNGTAMASFWHCVTSNIKMEDYFRTASGATDIPEVRIQPSASFQEQREFRSNI